MLAFDRFSRREEVLEASRFWRFVVWENQNTVAVVAVAHVCRHGAAAPKLPVALVRTERLHYILVGILPSQNMILWRIRQGFRFSRVIICPIKTVAR